MYMYTHKITQTHIYICIRAILLSDKNSLFGTSKCALKGDILEESSYDPVYIHIHMYMYTHTKSHTHIYIYIYIHVQY